MQPELNQNQCQFKHHFRHQAFGCYTDAGALSTTTDTFSDELLYSMVLPTTSGPGAEISLVVSSSAGQVLLEYRDNGAGMNSDTLKAVIYLYLSPPNAVKATGV